MTIELSNKEVIHDFDKCIFRGVMEMKAQLDNIEEWMGQLMNG